MQTMPVVQVAKEQLLLEGELTPFHTVVLRLPVTDETHIAPALVKVAAALGNQVSIGSYPVRISVKPAVTLFLLLVNCYFAHGNISLWWYWGLAGWS